MSQDTVDAWIREVKSRGINSIICLLADDQLDLYDALPSDLVSYYRAAGFAVTHPSYSPTLATRSRTGRESNPQNSSVESGK